MSVYRVGLRVLSDLKSSDLSRAKISNSPLIRNDLILASL